MYEEDGETAKKHWVNTSGEAIKSYIDPQFWDEYRPKEDIQKAHTPDWHEKTPLEERDIDEYAEARAKKNELTLSKTWVESLLEKGFSSPLIKEITNDLSQMWFVQNGIDYVAQLSPSGITNVEKATFTDPTRFSKARQNAAKQKDKNNQKGNNPEVVNLTDDD